MQYMVLCQLGFRDVIMKTFSVLYLANRIPLTWLRFQFLVMWHVVHTFCQSFNLFVPKIFYLILSYVVTCWNIYMILLYRDNNFIQSQFRYIIFHLFTIFLCFIFMCYLCEQIHTKTYHKCLCAYNIFSNLIFCTRYKKVAYWNLYINILCRDNAFIQSQVKGAEFLPTTFSSALFLVLPM
jgi:hypothetical protein